MVFDSIGIKKHTEWHLFFQEEMEKPYFKKLQMFVEQERENHIVFPIEQLMYNAFALTSFEQLKVVVIGQDPYHGQGQAHGLSFSVPIGMRKPPSLQNIFKELNQDIGMNVPTHGNLESWAKQGVFLLNACLTVRKQTPTSHQNKGWEIFTNAVIKKISTEKQNIVFLLWGNFAQQKENLIDHSKHLILKAVHPSPMSVYRGFFGCKHFSKTNCYLKTHQIIPIDWNTVNK